MTKINKSLNDFIGELDYKTLTDIFSVGFDGIRYWGTVDYDKDDYNKAKQHLIEMENTNLCLEEVLGQMLIDGGKIHIVDVEDGEESEYTKDLTLENLKHGIELFILNPKYHSCATDDWRDMDAIDGDIVIQFALFEDIIFG